MQITEICSRRFISCYDPVTNVVGWVVAIFAVLVNFKKLAVRAASKHTQQVPMSSQTNSSNTVQVTAATVVALGAVGAYYYLKGRSGTEPNYATDPRTWFAYGAKGNKRADLFYAHPTTAAGLLRWNMNWEDMGNTCTGQIAGDPDLLVGQAAAWAEEANLYAPKYRQQGFLAMGTDLESSNNNDARMKASLDMAAGDLEQAFRHFLAARPDKSRPFIVAAHSQGAILMSRVLARCVEGTEHAPQLVAAYLAGGYVPLDLFGPVFKDLHACRGPTDMQCIISYDTRTAAFKPESMNHMFGSIGVWPHHLHWLLHDKYCERPIGEDPGKPRLQINPMTWTTDGGGVHLGASLTSSMVKPPSDKGPGDMLVPPEAWGSGTTVTPYSISVPDPDTWWPGANHAGGEGNLHPIDVQFWYGNIQSNVKERLAAWFAAHQ